MSIQNLFLTKKSLNKFFDNIPFGVFVMDNTGRISSSNKAADEILCMSKVEIKQISLFDIISPKDIQAFGTYFNQIIAQNDTEDDLIEIEVKNGKGEFLVIEVRVNINIVEEDNHFIVVINNISKRRKLELAFQQQSKSHKVMQEKLAKEQELSELKSRFVTIASHEFRTPLAGILSSVNLIARYIDADKKEGVVLNHELKVKNHFTKIKESVGNLTQILNEFLSLAKLEEGKVVSQLKLLNLKELGEEIHEELLQLAKENQEITMNFDLQKVECRLDYNMIRNILLNLGTNAIKYSKSNSKIEFMFKMDSEILSIQVKDNGIGIPENEQSKLFGRFFRAKNVTNLQGTGLGLNIVKKYIELMHGSIRFESQENVGTCFFIEIPQNYAV
ncbi:MAG: PAS domain S-box protein [Bacteroidetes bacterium]|nr:MAG: PAS domain S-box protein [Bacteroidota bacterium]MBL1145702.1 PAS domain S-box protein [Bacteroidota bacterium]MCB0370408.1 PAS domain-containing sensor histidine kinase [Bdellovibrionales bacterium]NOG58496.1 PAS domain-containing sensor histidine kinase [Bacteroidota bacterium]